MIQIILLGLLAGVDNLQVAAAISMAPLTKARRALFALVFCACEISAPLVGLLLMDSLRVRFGDALDRVAPLILVCGGALIIDLAWRGDDQLDRIVNNKWALVALPLSLSADNLLIGASIGTLGYPLPLAAFAIG